ncbi:unnamed protein product [Notodromas monacha]|uniref:Single-strand selective monofunctional uracil DNA glycosylase n=1 Tax=Notodromas monacha TaxID=399045 RepID=A0A7R9GD89_9CRUS|nr:unnamed protein product [Notodromas monacha]CAG0916922.1 unnamed protein product [Notodromas monacha]
MCSKRRSEIEDLDADCKISRQDDARIIETQELPGLAARILAIEKLLSGRLNSLDYGEKVEYLYNPILYAEDLHTKFLSKFLVGPTEVFFLGMNPGPFGMCQTGIPFGEVGIVRNWMQIDGLVGKPAREHPKRLVLGMSSNRSEPSGKRFWSFFEHLCKSPENFFSKAFVYNYCPAAFLDSKGANVTPVDLKVCINYTFLKDKESKT